MALFSDFCNICYKTSDGSLKDISEENVTHLKNTLITFIGHADIIKHNVIYLCQLCREKLTHFDRFREMCVSHLIQLRQMYFNMKSKLEFEEGVVDVENTLAIFVHEEIRRSSEKSVRLDSIPMECHEVVNSSAELNKNDSVFNRQDIKLQLERNKCEIDGDCSKVSIINSVAKCDESRDLKTKLINGHEVTKLEKFEREFEEVYDMSDIITDNESNASETEFMREFDKKNKIDARNSESCKEKIFENESIEHVKLIEVPDVNNIEASSRIDPIEDEIRVKQENNTSEDSELETIENESKADLDVPFEFVNVCTTVIKQEYGDGDIRFGEDAKAGMKVQCRHSSNSTFQTMNTQSSLPHAQEHRDGGNPALQATTSCLTTQNDDGPHKCNVCDKAFSRSSTLIRHERIHSGDRPYKCSVCNKGFSRFSILKIHGRTHSGDRPYKCSFCNKAFRDLSALTKHERIHSGERPYQCTVCNKTFSNSSALIKHERIHSGDRPYECTDCNKAFMDSSALIKHKRIHSGDRPYKCTICDKAFTQSSSLMKHKYTHSGDRPFKCPVCNKAYIESSSLVKHERTHSGDRPYECTICKKPFAYLSAMIRHKRIHSGDRPYKCTVCDKLFAQSCTLTRHERTHSSDKP